MHAVPMHQPPPRARTLALVLWLLAPALFGPALFAPSLAAAQPVEPEARSAPPPAPKERAGTLADAAATASSVGAHGFAVRALLRAHELSPSEGLLYGIARGYEQRFKRTRDPADARRALHHYRQLAATSTGKHLAAARRAIEVLAPSLGDRDVPVEPDEAGTWLAVTASTLGAEAVVDGGPSRALPLFVEVEPGAHELVVSAADHESQVRSVEISSGDVAVVQIVLTPRPAKLAFEGAGGAVLHLDGKTVGPAPEQPFEVEPGPHFVAFTAMGHHPFSRSLDVGRGETKTLAVELRPTPMRLAAWPTLSLGGTSLTAAIVCGGVAVLERRSANDLASSGGGLDALSDADRQRYDDKLARRDDLGVAAAVTGGIGLALVVVGGALFVLDDPAAPAPPGAGAPPAVSFAPLLGPTSAGATMTVGF